MKGVRNNCGRRKTGHLVLPSTATSVHKAQGQWPITLTHRDSKAKHNRRLLIEIPRQSEWPHDLAKYCERICHKFLFSHHRARPSVSPCTSPDRLERKHQGSLCLSKFYQKKRPLS